MGVIYILTSVVKSYDDKGKLLLGPDVKNVKHGRNRHKCLPLKGDFYTFLCRFFAETIE